MPKHAKNIDFPDLSGQEWRRERFRLTGDTLLGDKYITKVKNKEMWCLRFSYGGIAVQWYYRSKNEAIEERKRLISAVVEENSIANVKPINNVRPPYYKLNLQNNIKK